MAETSRPARKRFAGMTHNEYRANITGLNIFFGAVLGVVMAGAEALTTRGFAILLLLTAGIVISILYISASRRRIVYAVLAGILVAVLPTIFAILSLGGALPAKLQPTLAVWALMMAVIEFVPREPAPEVEPIPHPAEGGD